MGWDITITDNNGDTHQPALYAPRGERLPRRQPAANGRPTLVFGVAPQRDGNGDPKWFASKFEEADVSVTLDGTDQPYSTITAVRDRPSAGIVEIEAEGGSELDTAVDVSFGVIETHTAAKQIVQDNTSYGVDIPTPSTTTSTETVLDNTDGIATSDLQPPPAEDSPVHVTDQGTVTLYQTLHFHDPSTTLSAVGDELTFSFTTNYSIPTDRVGMAVLSDATDVVGLQLKVDDEVIGEVQPGTTYTSTPAWDEVFGADTRLAPGDHTAIVEVTAAEDAAGSSLSSVSPNGVAVYDDKFPHFFDPDLVDGPELYPPTDVYARFAEPLVTRAVTGIDYRGYFADNNPGVPFLSNGQQNASTGDDAQFGADFDDRGAVVDLEVGLSAYGQDPNKTPETGFKATELTAYTLDADLETMPLVVDEQFEGTVADVLTELADTLRGDFVWTYDTDSNGDGIVRFVQSGSRSTTENNLEDYTVAKRAASRVDEVTVRGGRERVSGEGVRVQHDTAVALDRDRLTEGSETVTDPDDGTVFERGKHYTIDYSAGELTAESTVSRGDPIDDQSIVRVSYEFQPSATVEADSQTDPIRSETVDILPLRSDRACRLAGKQLLDALSTPRFDAEATVRGNTTYSVVTELAASRLPTGNLETVDIEATPAGSRVRLEARQSVGEIIDGLKDRIQAVAKHTR